MTIQVQSSDAKADAEVNKPAEAGKPAAPKDETPPSAAPAEGESPKPEQKEPDDSEPSGTEENEVSDAEDGSAESLESDAKPDEASDKQTKKKSGFQKRIDKLNQRAAAKDQEIEYWKREALKGATAQGQTPNKVEPTKPAAAEGKPKAESFETHAEYVEALTDWKAKQVLSEHNQKLQQRELETAQAKQVTTYQQKAKAFAAAHPDFDEVVGEMVASPTVVGIIQASEIGPEIAYELGKNPDEAKRIAMLPPAHAAFELGAIKSRIASKASGEKKPEPKRVSSAPAPIAPVGGSGKGSNQKSIFDHAISQSEYERARKEQMKQRRQA